MTRKILLAIAAVTAIPMVLLVSACSSCRRSPGAAHTSASASAAPSAALQNGTASEPSGPALEMKTYNPAGKAQNRAVEFSIPSFSVTGTLGSRNAPEGKIFLVIDTVWKNIIPLAKVAKHQDDAAGTNGAGGLGFGSGQEQKQENPGDYELKPTPYLVSDLNTHAFVVINGGETAVISDAQPAAAQPLAIEQIDLPAPNAEVRGQLVYEIPAGGVSSVVFRYLDTSMGSFDVVLYGKPPRATAPIAGPVNNDVLETSVYGVQQMASVGSVSAPGGEMFVVVQLGCVGKSEGGLVQVELENYAYLRDARDGTFAPTKNLSVPGEFKGTVQFLPGTLQRGSLAFSVPAQHGALALVINLPGYSPLELSLPNTATVAGGSSAAAAPPPVLFTISDGETLDVQIHGLSATTNLGNVQAEEGKRYVVLDLTLVCKVDQGIEFQTGQQLKLLDGEQEILADASATEKLPQPLSEDSVVPAHGRGRFQVAYQVPVTTRNLVLYYRGFNREERHGLAVQ